MIRFLIGVFVGIYISTVGLAGLIRSLDRGVEVVKDQSKDLAR